ncbi:protein glp-1-like [Antedon mediterranea]|uniref:protein glp-1-like n=1 Tax=Antedon mediterranea TaxID=105859 RepID=UPI003AF4488D
MICRSEGQYKVYLVFIFATMALVFLTVAENCLDCDHGICDGSKCRCHDGYGGKLCNVCVPSQNCVNGYCINPGGCRCNPGWHGMFCDIDSKGYCHYNVPCLNGGTCYSLGKQGFTCTCAEGYSGIRCQNHINESCINGQCKNNGTCVDSRDGMGCLCPIDYEGVHCETFTGRCQEKTCPVNSTCVHTSKGYRCDCKQKQQCEQTLMRCTESSCDEGLECIKTPGQLGFSCDCPRGTAGRACSMRPLCIMNTCLNGGKCFETLNNVMCVCNDGYTGLRCETKLEQCEYNPCANNGTCAVGPKGHLCDCPAGYSERYCECKITSDEKCGTKEPINEGCTLWTNNWNQKLLMLNIVIYYIYNHS